MRRIAAWVVCGALVFLPAVAIGQAGESVNQNMSKWEFQNLGIGNVLTYMGDILRQRGKMSLQVQWKGLETAGLEKTTLISGGWPEVKFSTALELVCRLANSTGNGTGDMCWFVDNGAVVVTSQRDLANSKTLRHYPGGTDELAEIVNGFLDPELTGGEAVATVQGNRLAVNGSRKVQEEVARLLKLCQTGMTGEALGGLLGPLKALSSARISLQGANKVEAVRWIALLREASHVWVVLDLVSMERAGLDPHRTFAMSLKEVPGDKALGLLMSEIGAGGKDGLALDNIGGEILMVTTAAAARKHLAAFDITPKAARKLNMIGGQDSLEMVLKQVDPAAIGPAGPAGGELALVGQNRSRILCRARLSVLAALARMLEVEVAAPASPRPGPPRSPALTSGPRPGDPSETPASSRPAEGGARLTPANPPAPAEAASSEDEAAKKLLLAQTYIDNKMMPQARTVLQSIISKYPNTRAAAQAEQELKKLGPADTK